MARTLRSDKVLFWATLLLVGASLVMVFSASAVQSMEKYGSQYYYLFRQMAWAAVGFALMVTAMRIDYHEYRKPAVIWAVLAAVVATLCAVFFFPASHGAHRWLSAPGVSIQPSEVAKLAAILFTAALLERRMNRIHDVNYALLPVGIVTVVLAGLIIMEPDFGTTAVLVLVVAAMVFTAGLGYRHLVVVGAILAAGAVIAVIASPYRMQRLLSFLDCDGSRLSSCFQIDQSLIAVGSGGTLGKGLMAGVQKLYYIPEPHTDFIFSVIGEELGLVGGTVILLCFAVVAWRGMRAALLAPDRFGLLVAIGLTTMVAIQALLNIAVVTQLLPTKGIPLPFVSSGGSSLVVNLLAMGILLNISQQASRVSGASAVAAEARG